MLRFILVLFGLLSGGAAHAIQCIDLDTPEKREQFIQSEGLQSRIFRGTATSAERKTSEALFRFRIWLGSMRELFGGEPYFGTEDDRRRVVSFKILETFEGPPRDAVVETSLVGGLDGGAFLEVGKEYLVFAHRRDSSESWFASYCDRTALATAATSDLEWLRNRKTRTGSASTTLR